MSNEPLSKQIMIGLPSAGKSTFLAALWQVVTSNEIPESLMLVKLDSDTAYIDNIHKRWLTGEEVGRTQQTEEGSEEKVVMMLGNDKIGQTEITFPDLSGEIFDLQWVNREWTASYNKLVSSSSGAILFLNPKTIKEGKIILGVVEEMINELEDLDENVEEEEIINEQEEIEEFDPIEAPTQVKMVELLQFIVEKPYLRHLKNIAVIVSSWDIAKDRFKSPDEFVAKQLPLLNQYLHANQERFSFHIYGISGQGGELVDTEGNRTPKADELVDLLEPSKRILVQEGKGEPHHDITAPIKWLIEASRNENV